MRQHAKHVNTKMLSLQTAVQHLFFPSPLSILQHQNNGKKCFIYVTHLPLLFMMRVTTLQRAGVIISILWFTKGEIWQNKEHKWNLGLFCWIHGVWKPQKRSFSTLRAKRATFNILSGQKLLKNAKNGPFWRVFENLKLAVKQCYQTGQF